jgi:hypothetical protein
MEKSVRANTELRSFVHLKSKGQFIPPNYHSETGDLLFDIHGRPQCIEAEGGEDAFTCIFVVAKLFPGGTKTKWVGIGVLWQTYLLTLFERLDTLLELKIENESSQQRLAMLTAGINESTQAYSSLSMQPNGPGAMDASPQNLSYYPGQPSGRGDLLLSPARSAFDDGASGSNDIYPSGSIPSPGEDGSEDKSKKKKVNSYSALF